MPQSSGISGQSFARKIVLRVKRYGELLTVTTPAKNGNAEIVRQVRFLPQPLAPNNLAQMQAEGTINVAEGIPTDFLCDGTAKVYAMDEILYQGCKWEVLGAVPERLQGVTLLQHAVAKRL